MLLLSKVKINLRRKLTIVLILGLSVIMIAVAIIRISAPLLPYATIDGVWFFFWVSLEASISIIMLSVTAFRSIFGQRRTRGGSSSRPRLFPKFTKAFSDNSGSGGGTNSADKSGGSGNSNGNSNGNDSQPAKRNMSRFFQWSSAKGSTAEPSSVEQSGHLPPDMTHYFRWQSNAPSDRSSVASGVDKLVEAGLSGYDKNGASGHGHGHGHARSDSNGDKSFEAGVAMTELSRLSSPRSSLHPHSVHSSATLQPLVSPVSSSPPPAADHRVLATPEPAAVGDEHLCRCTQCGQPTEHPSRQPSTRTIEVMMSQTEQRTTSPLSSSFSSSHKPLPRLPAMTYAPPSHDHRHYYHHHPQQQQYREHQSQKQQHQFRHQQARLSRHAPQCSVDVPLSRYARISGVGASAARHVRHQSSPEWQQQQMVELELDPWDRHLERISSIQPYDPERAA